MTTNHDRRPFIGEWRIVEMEQWDRDDLDLLGPAYLTLDRRGQGTMRFVAIEALRGRVFLHDGDESAFSATRHVVRRRARSARQRKH